MVRKASFGGWPHGRPLCKLRIAPAIVLLLAFALQSVDVHAELLFRTVEQINGQPTWSPIRKYSNPSDTSYARVSSSGATAPAQEVRVFLSGEITRADIDSAAVMGSLLKSGKQKILGNTVWLASNGGDIDTGMDLGRLLRKAGIFTLIARDDQCLSACVFAFMGGERRSVAGRLGIHRPFFPFTQETADRPARFRHLQRTLKDYVEEMDFPPSLYEAVMLVPPESMQILAPADLKKFYLEGISPSSEDMIDAASARRLGISMSQYLQRKAKAPACLFSVLGCDGQLQETTASGAADDLGRIQPGGSASANRTAGRSATGTSGTGLSGAASRDSTR